MHQRGDGVAGERDEAGEQPVEHAAERVDVGPRVHRAGLDLLGRRVVEAGQDRPGPGELRGAVQGLGDAEVGQEDLLGSVVAVGGRRQEDVGRLDVPVDQVVAVGAVERGRSLGDDVHCPGDGQAAWGLGQHPLDVDAVDELHGQPELAGVLAAVEDGHDVAVGQAGHHVGLVLETGDEGRGRSTVPAAAASTRRAGGAAGAAPGRPRPCRRRRVGGGPCTRRTRRPERGARQPPEAGGPMLGGPVAAVIAAGGRGRAAQCDGSVTARLDRFCR